MFHERDPATLDRACDQHFRNIGSRVTHACECRRQRIVVVPVALLDVPPERVELRPEITEPEDLVCALVRLQLVAVDDRPKVADALVRGRCERLPVLSLL